MTNKVTVLGIGNTLMGDDGVGTHVARLLAGRDMGENVSVVEGGVAGMALVPHFVESHAVVVVDAIAAGDEPGSVYRLSAEDAGLTGLRSNTSHGLSLPSVLFAARMQGADPHVVIYGIEIADITQGFETLSPGVAAALPDVVEMVAEEAVRLSAGHSGFSAGIVAGRTW